MGPVVISTMGPILQRLSIGCAEAFARDLEMDTASQGPARGMDIASLCRRTQGGGPLLLKADQHRRARIECLPIEHSPRFEAGFFAAFLGPAGLEPSLIPVLALRWMLFRVELGAGLIKLRHDRCWRELTCLYYHYETQPMPNPLSAYFHHLPKPVHRASVAFSHFVQIVAPFGLFAPQPISAIAGCFIIVPVHQLVLIEGASFLTLKKPDQIRDAAPRSSCGC